MTRSAYLDSTCLARLFGRLAVGAVTTFMKNTTFGLAETVCLTNYESVLTGKRIQGRTRSRRGGRVPLTIGRVVTSVRVLHDIWRASPISISCGSEKVRIEGQELTHPCQEPAQHPRPPESDVRSPSYCPY